MVMQTIASKENPRLSDLWKNYVFFPFSMKNTLLTKLEIQAKADVRPILHLFCVMNVLSSYLWHYSLFANLKFNCEHPSPQMMYDEEIYTRYQNYCTTI